MRKLFALLAVVAAMTLGTAGTSHAAALSFTGSFSVIIGTLPGITVGLAGTAVSNTASSIQLPASVQTKGTTVLTGITAAPPITRLQLTGFKNDAGTLNLGSASPLGVNGNTLVQAYGGFVNLVSVPAKAAATVPSDCNVAFVGGACTNFSFTTAASRGIGLGGAPILVTGFGNIIYATGGAWTAGTAAVVLPGATPAGGATTATPMTQTAMGADNRTAGGVGSVIFVSPLRIRTNVAGNLVAFAQLTLNFIPEPGTLLLLGSGIAGLAALGRRRVRH